MRPTLRALNDLGLGFPSLDQALEKLDEPLIRKAQDLPSEVSAGGAERVLSLNDRVWFKVKTQDERGAAGEVPSPGEHELPPIYDFVGIGRVLSWRGLSWFVIVCGRLIYSPLASCT